MKLRNNTLANFKNADYTMLATVNLKMNMTQLTQNGEQKY